MSDSVAIWKQSLAEAQTVLSQFVSDPKNLELCRAFSTLLLETYKNKGTVFSCGNGGSHCDALHFAEELTGRYRKDRAALGALALGESTHQTCVANDYGFEQIFSRQLEGLGRAGDTLLLLSTSGNSKNLLRAAQAAKNKGLKTVALLGRGGGELKKLVDLSIVVPGETSDRIQELHIKLLHIVIETIERELFPQNY